MSEGLKSLKELLEILDYYKDKAQRNFQTIRIFSELPNYIKEIETELKEYETLQDDFNKLYERTYKEHKALETIKEYKLITYQECFDAICTSGYVHNLPKDKVELLKEVFYENN